jgi:hypothetical protein
MRRDKLPYLIALLLVMLLAAGPSAARVDGGPAANTPITVANDDWPWVTSR